MTLLLCVTISLFWGWVTARFAHKKGLNPRNWYIAGILFCSLAFIVLLFQRKKNVFPSTPKVELYPVDSSQKQILWYYLNAEGKQFGPLKFESFTKAWEEKKVGEDSYVWNESLDDWKKFKEVLQVTTLKN